MSKKHENKPKSKRQMIREERQRKERRQRLITVGIIVAVALGLVALIAIPAIRGANEPPEVFTQITPGDYPLADGSTLGDPEAKVLIQVFEDFKCSACQSFTQYHEPQVIKEIVETGKARYVFHQYPFLTADESLNAANASECAAEQKQFWNYKNLVTTNYNGVDGEFSDKRLEVFAEYLDLDMEEFKACYAAKRYQAKISEDYRLGGELGVTGTPAVFVNGVNVAEGKVPTFEQILALVDKALAESGE